jgi:hypothetical protein
MATGDKYSGSDGSVSFNGTVIKITNWKLTRNVGIQKITDSGSGADHEYQSDGVKDKSGSFSGYVLVGTATPEVGVKAALILYYADGRYWTGNAIIREVSEGAAIAGEAPSFDVNFQGTGAFVETKES